MSLNLFDCFELKFDSLQSAKKYPYDIKSAAHVTATEALQHLGIVMTSTREGEPLEITPTGLLTDVSIEISSNGLLPDGC